MRRERKRKEPLSLTRPSICLNHLRNIKPAASHLCRAPPWLDLVGPRILRTPHDSFEPRILRNLQDLVGLCVLRPPRASSSVKRCLLGLDGGIFGYQSTFGHSLQQKPKKIVTDLPASDLEKEMEKENEKRSAHDATSQTVTSSF